MYLYYQQQVQAYYIPKKGFASKGYQFDIEWDAQSELFFALKKGCSEVLLLGYL